MVLVHIEQASVVDKNVDPPETGHGGVDQAFAVGGDGDVAC